MEIGFTRAARRHRIGRASVRFVMARQPPTEVRTNDGDVAWRWHRPDERERWLEVIAVEVQGPQDREAVLLVIHVMPDYGRKEP